MDPSLALAPVMDPSLVLVLATAIRHQLHTPHPGTSHTKSRDTIPSHIHLTALSHEATAPSLVLVQGPATAPSHLTSTTKNRPTGGHHQRATDHIKSMAMRTKCGPSSQRRTPKIVQAKAL
ncbi:hypothetical protein EYR41_004264 [Orbilia oligospora]|uniref:Uncharacterized protein n=1 Tax=Orbilia oligospora TaxID=2813651 RepID=A0A7C8KIQ6_ORBOL|nr:hypothetical protein TWF751_005188 [Orbilia oligospora]TGJ72365.1 hypothetical protein EYR41_004264 [Orbilia oligospora]